MAYTLTGRKGGAVRFVPFQTGVIEKESESYSSSVTSNPIEAGSEINDHVNNAAGTLNISGTIVGGDSAINVLKAMRDSRDLITYTGVTRMSNLVFTSIKFDRTSKNKNGASFSATLKQVQVTASGYVSVNAVEPMIDQDRGKNSDAQLAKTASAGLTTVALQSVSFASAENYREAYKGSYSSAPLMRVTGGYNGLSAY